MKRGKRILAMAVAIVLIGMCVSTLVFAVFATPAAKEFFKVSLLATLMLPILIYVYLLLYRLITGKGEDMEEKNLKKSEKPEKEASD